MKKKTFQRFTTTCMRQIRSLENLPCLVLTLHCFSKENNQGGIRSHEDLGIRIRLTRLQQHRHIGQSQTEGLFKKEYSKVSKRRWVEC